MATLSFHDCGVQDIFSKAKHPERVFVGSVQQLATDIEEACWRPGKPAMPAMSSILRAEDGRPPAKPFHNHSAGWKPQLHSLHLPHMVSFNFYALPYHSKRVCCYRAKVGPADPQHHCALLGGSGPNQRAPLGSHAVP